MILPSRLTIVALAGCAILLPTAVGLGWTAGVAKRNQAAAERKAAGYHQEIYEPNAGYRDRLTTCSTSLAGAQASVETQNKAIQALRDSGAAATRQAQDRLAAEQARTRAAQSSYQALLQSRPHEGETACDAAFRLHQENSQ